MNCKRLLSSRSVRISFAVLCAVIVPALNVVATPIQPSVQQLLNEAQQPAMPYVPAQAGWNGPMIESQPNPANFAVFDTSQILHDAELARARRQILLQVATPDPRVLLAFGAIIFLLRKMRSLRESPGVPAPHPA
ncbi:MAG TPA: hypothetical protein VFA71_10735 [Terriglobales bacterium]|nr:hypothetical protein [Terriglobales bacterium]